MLKSVHAEIKIMGAMLLVVLLTVLGWVNMLVYEAYEGHLHNIIIEQNSIHIQQLPIRARAYYDNDDNQRFKQLRETVNDIERSLQLISQGGVLTHHQNPYEIRPIEGREVQQQINAFGREFKLHKERLQALVVSSMSSEEGDNSLLKLRSNAEIALNYLTENNDRLVVFNKRIGEGVFRHMESERNKTRFVLFVIVLLILVISGFALYVFRQAYVAKIQLYVQKTSVDLQMEVQKQGETTQTLANFLSVLSANIQAATRFAKEIGTGRFEYHIEEELQKTPLGHSLTEMRARLLSFSEEEQRQTWFNNGVAEVTQLLNSHKLDDVEELCFNFLKYVVKRLEVNQGAIFLRMDTEEDVFELKACYAFDKKKFMKRSIRLGEGLIGQSIAEEGISYTEQIPENYIQITSGLGTAPPRVLLIVPIRDQDTVYGAIEIASFHSIFPHQIEFVEIAARRFAEVLASLQISLNTQRLLDETRRVNLQLQEKEEQMTQNARKLENTQQVLNDKLAELEAETTLSRNIIEAINKTSATVEFDLYGNILEVNDMYLSIMGYTRRELIGANEQQLVSDDELRTERYTLLWNSLRQGAFLSGEYKRINKQGKEVWLNGTYNPIFDVEGNAYKVIQIAQFTTEEKEKDLDYTSKINAISNSFPLLDLDVNGKIISGNSNFVKFSGLKRKEFRSRSFPTLLQTEESQRFFSLWERVVQGEIISETLRFDVRRQDVFCLVSMNPIYNLSGQIYKVLAILIDVTPQKKLELSLKQSTSQLSRTVSELEVVQEHLNHQKRELEMRMRMLNRVAFIFEIDEKHTVTTANKDLCQKLDTTRIQLLGKPFREIVYADLASVSVEEFFLLTEQEMVHRATLPYHSFSDTLWWGDTTAAVLKDEEGNVQRYIGIIFDTTKQVQQEASLRELLSMEKAKNVLLQSKKDSSEKPLAALLEQIDFDNGISASNIDNLLKNATTPTLLLDSQGVVLQCSPSARVFFQEDPVQQHVGTWIHLSEGDDEMLSKLLTEGLFAEKRARFQGKGINEMLDSVFIPLFSNEGQAARTLLVLFAAP